MIYHGWGLSSMTTFTANDDYYTQNIKVSVTNKLLDLGYAVFAPSASLVLNNNDGGKILMLKVKDNN